MMINLLDLRQRWLTLLVIAVLFPGLPAVSKSETAAATTGTSASALERGEAKELRFTILHTNDLHSHELPFEDNGHLIGGIAKIARLMQTIRSGIQDTITIDAGDIFEGTPFFRYYKGAVEVKMLNDAGCNVYTIGNHEFDDGPENLGKQLQQAKFDVINCNLDAAAYPQLAAIIKPSVVKTIAGQQVAFIGAICPDLDKVTFRSDKARVVNADGDWIKPIRAEIDRVKKLGINKIILVTHVGVDRDKLLGELTDVDAIIGGHSHTRLEKPLIVSHSDGSNCVIVQTGCYGRALGQLDLCFQPDGKVDLRQVHYKLLDIEPTLPADSGMADYLHLKAQPFQALAHEKLAVATERFANDWSSCMGDSALGNLVTDALAEAAAKYGATIAFENRGGLRADIEKGTISSEDVEDILPFANKLQISTITGEDLRKVLETSVGGSPVKSIVLGAQFVDVHGLKFEWNPKLPPMHRVKRIWTVDKAGEPQELKPEAKYRVAFNDYAMSAEGFDFTRAEDIVDTGKRLSFFLRAYLLKHKTVSPRKEGRIIPLQGSDADAGK